MEVFSKRGRQLASQSEQRREDAKRARLCELEELTTTQQQIAPAQATIPSAPLMEAVTQLSQSMDSVNTATGEEEVSTRTPDRYRYPNIPAYCVPFLFL